MEVKNIVSSIASEGKKVNEAAFFMLPCPVGGHGSGTHWAEKLGGDLLTYPTAFGAIRLL